jgi:hypothetical protein
MKRLRLPVLFYLLAATALAAEPAPVLPASPSALLGVLPAAPADWTILSSVADSKLNQTIETRATRLYQAPPEEKAAPDAPRGEVELSVLDTGGYLPALGAFTNFQPLKEGPVEKHLIGTLPAITLTTGEGERLTQVLVAARYIVEITLRRQPGTKAEAWLRTLRFDLLPSAIPAPAAAPREFRAVHLDELQPENNRSYLISTTDGERRLQYLRARPPERDASPTR